MEEAFCQDPPFLSGFLSTAAQMLILETRISLTTKPGAFLATPPFPWSWAEIAPLPWDQGWSMWVGGAFKPESAHIRGTKFLLTPSPRSAPTPCSFLGKILLAHGVKPRLSPETKSHLQIEKLSSLQTTFPFSLTKIFCSPSRSMPHGTPRTSSKWRNT